MMDAYTRDKTAAYMLGAGVMGVIAGLGLGGRPNTLILLTGIGSLAYANYLGSLVDVGVSPRVAQTAKQVRQRIPNVGTSVTTSTFLY